jgi:hypothetical protein
MELPEGAAVVASFQRVGHASHMQRALPSRRGVTLQGWVVEDSVSNSIVSDGYDSLELVERPEPPSSRFDQGRMDELRP